MKKLKLLLVLVVVLALVPLTFAACEDHTHAFGNDYTIVTAPTATAEGSATHTCACGETETVAIPALSDTSVWTAVANPGATHTTDGTMSYFSVYGKVDVAVAKTGDHTFDQHIATDAFKVSDATCSAKAVYYVSCVCGVKGTETFEYGETLAHSYSAFVSWSVQPTLTTDGTALLKCANCSATTLAPVAKLSDASVWTATVVTPVSHTADGTTDYSNAAYGKISVTVPKTTDHSYVGEIISQPTCETAGATKYVCSVCQDTYTMSISALGHSWSTDAIELESDSSYHVNYCTRCNAINNESKTTHTYGEDYQVVAKDINGTEISYAHACTACGHVETTVEVPGYVEYAWGKGDYVAPTYFKAGSQTYTKGSYTYVEVLPKLVAPYESKTYSVIEVSHDDGIISGKITDYNWSGCKLVIDANGNGTATSNPFNGSVSFTAYNDANCQVTFTCQGSTDKKTYTGSVTEDGVMAVIDEDGTRYILIPSEDVSSNDINGSFWKVNNEVIYAVNVFLNCSYAEGHQVNAFFKGNNAYIGGWFEDIYGDKVSAVNCYNNENGVVVGDFAAYVFDGTTLVESDGYHGEYDLTVDGAPYGTAVLSGEGHFTITDIAGNTISGTYKEDATQDGKFDIYVIEDGKKIDYLSAQFVEEILVANHVKVNLTYNFGSHYVAESEVVRVSINIPVELLSPVSKDADYMFTGWYADEAFKTPVTELVLTKDSSATTLYAKWDNKIIIALDDKADTTKTSVELALSASTLSALPSYTAEEIKEIGGTSYYFAGWTFKTDDDEIEIDETTTNTADMASGTIVANWKLVPAYYGSYKMFDTGYEANKWSGSKTLTFALDGTVTGSLEGTVASYDTATGKITLDSNKFVYFDAASQTMVGSYSTLGSSITVNELYFGAKDLASNDDYVNYAVKIDSSTYNARFFAYNGHNTLFYNGTYYGDVAVTDALGNALAVSTSESNSIQSAQTLIAKDSAGNTIFAVAADGTSFKGGTKTKSLDSYFGTYTLTDGTIVFDGLGNFVWGEKSGTYTKTDAGFDLFVVKNDVNVEYHTMTVAEGTKDATITAQTVTLTLVVPADTTKNSTITAYLKVATALPVDISVDGKIFRGWYKEEAFTTAIENNSFVATESTTLYANYQDKVTVTLHFNDGTTENETKQIAKGETLTLDVPTYAKHSFVSWHTDADLSSEAWVSGTTVVSANIDLYAKWEDCAYAQSYTFAYISSYRNSNSSSSGYMTIKTATDGLSFVGTGVGTFAHTDNKEVLPFDGCTSTASYTEGSSWSGTTVYVGYDITINAYDKATGLVTFNVVKHGKSSDSTYTYYGYLDSATGIIVADYAKASKTFEKVAVFLPEGYAISGTYASLWGKAVAADGKAMFIDYTDSANAVHTIFVDNGTVYFDATVVDSANAHISADSVYKANYVKVSNGSTDLYTVGYNGTTLVAFDGYEGTYTATGDAASITLDGLGSITIGSDSAKITITNNAANVTVGGVYYEITNIDKTAHTCTVSAPKATVNFVLEHASLTGGTAQQVGIKVAYTLPTPTCDTGYQFIGWYKEDTFATKVTSVTLDTTEAVTYYAKIEAVPAWADKATATEVAYSDNVAFSGETNELNQTYYAKLVVAEAGNYYFYSDDPTKVGGNGGISYARYSILDSDGKGVTSGTKLSFDSYNTVSLTAGTYYVEVNLGGKVTGSSYTYKVWGTFAINVVKGAHDTADKAISYTLATETAVVEQSGEDKINTVYSVQLEAGKTYTLSITSTKYARISLYSDTTFSKTVNMYVGTSTSASTYVYANGSTNTAKITVETTGTYYIVTQYSLTFTLSEVTETAEA